MSTKAFSALNTNTVTLSWTRLDIEQKLFFSGSRFTRVNTLLSLVLAILLTLVFYGVLLLAPGTVFHSKFIGQGIIPTTIVFLSSWCLSILFLKWQKLSLQKRCVGLHLIPDETDFVLSPTTVDRVFDRMLELVDDPRQL
ncbi:MAG: hypothetical protein ABGZ53_27095, partial [Fuerstiella sp.]